jgi:ATP adenylyltransferase/5',5'''-P-1,P-4-tetraphosphate phosphorylase II
VESASLTALKVTGRHGRLPTNVTPERVLQLEHELQEKTTALAELSVAYTLLEKKERVIFPSSPPAPRSRRRRGK